MKNVLVIGGSYFAGRVFVERLAHHPLYEVHVFNRGNLALNLPGVAEYRGDRENLSHLRNRIPELHWDAVVDFCAYTPNHIEDVLANLTGSIGHYLFLSSTAVYLGNSTRPIGEDGAKVTGIQPELGDFADYGFNKWRAERALRSAAATRRIPCTILRPAIIYGRYNYAPREKYFFDALFSGKPLFIPQLAPARFSFVWVEDLASLLLLFIDKPGSAGLYNVAAPEQLNYADLAEIFIEACDSDSPIEFLKMSQLIRDGIPIPFPPDVNLLYDGQGICKAMQFTYTPFRDGIRRTWDHYRKIAEWKRGLAAQ